MYELFGHTVHRSFISVAGGRTLRDRRPTLIVLAQQHVRVCQVLGPMRLPIWRR